MLLLDVKNMSTINCLFFSFSPIMGANFQLKNKNLVNTVLLLILISISNNRYNSFKVYLR